MSERNKNGAERAENEVSRRRAVSGHFRNARVGVKCGAGVCGAGTEQRAGTTKIVYIKTDYFCDAHSLLRPFDLEIGGKSATHTLLTCSAHNRKYMLHFVNYRKKDLSRTR